MSADQAFQEISTDTLLTRMVERILATGSPQKIILFGSRARGEARRDSDYDLLLVEPSTLPRHKRAARYRRALIGVSPAKDILVWTPEEIAEWRDVPNAFVTTAIREGVLLYER
jgi:predicted nucleotidyltransferase